MRFNFFSRRQPLICFSRFSASDLDENVSVYNSWVAECNLVCHPPDFDECSLNLLSILFVTPV